MVIMVVICLPAILAFAILAINIAWMQLTRTELRTATDAAARAGSRTLSLTQDVAIARTVGNQAAANNTVAGQPLTLATSDLVFGKSSPVTGAPWAFTALPETSDELNSVRALGRRVAGSPSGPVPMLFAGMFDRTTFEPVKVAVATQTDRDVVLVLDRSGSMDDPTATGTKWSDLLSAVDVFLNTLDLTPQTEKVGLATYEEFATSDLVLTTDYQSIRDHLATLNPGGWTGIGRGVDAGRTIINDTTHHRIFASKTMVVMTDGKHNRGHDPEPQATIAHNNEAVEVHAVTFGPDDPTIVDKVRMQQVATNGHGQYYHAEDQADLQAVFEEIAKNLPTLLTE